MPGRGAGSNGRGDAKGQRGGWECFSLKTRSCHRE